MTMTARQITLARHALGLDGQRTVSFRNRFVAGPGHTDYPEWMAMATTGHARRRDDFFWLTRQGAELALRPGERLDPEDFPARN